MKVVGMTHEQHLAAIARRKRTIDALTLEHEEAIGTAYAAGLSLAKLGTAVDMTPEGIRKLLKRHGIATRPRKGAGG